MTEIALRMRQVTLVKRGHTVLEDVCLSIPAGEFVGLIGPNGGGKTMLLRLVLGLEQADAGQIEVFGRVPAAARELVGWVPQFASFDPDFPIRVGDVVASGLLGRSRSRADAGEPAERVAVALAQVGLCDHDRRQVGRLSGGEVQRMLVARALVGRPRLLLLDEPGASLDAPQSASLADLLTRLAGEHTIVLVSHDVGVISRHVGAIACLNRRLVYHDSSEITREMVEDVYGCPVDFVVHAHTHVVLPDHDAGSHP